MKKYKNISSNTLAIDCLGYTKYIKPGTIASLPLSRDVRHYSRLNNLILVKEKKEIVNKVEKPKLVEKQQIRLHSQKENKEKLNKKIEKIEKSIKEMENE